MNIGSLCSGYGGLDLGVMSVVGGSVAWHVEFDSAPSKILHHHWPDVPNYGDLTTLDWSTLPGIDVLTAGYPCQPFSIAGKRKGSADERHLWPYIKDAIRVLRPRLVVLENVRGHLTLGFDRVLGDLAELGYDARWVCLPASAAGAPHRRERIFIAAYPEGQPWRIGDRDDVPVVSDASGREPERRRGHERVVEPPRTGQGTGGKRERNGDAPDDRGSTSAYAQSQRRREGWTEPAGLERRSDDQFSSPPTHWGRYEAAVRRWENVFGRVAPAPTAPDGRNGQQRLSPRFVEWMMGLLDGHVTDPKIGLTRTQQLKALGNGVVPHHAAMALTLMSEPTDGEPE